MIDGMDWDSWVLVLWMRNCVVCCWSWVFCCDSVDFIVCVLSVVWLVFVCGCRLVLLMNRWMGLCRMCCFVWGCWLLWVVGNLVIVVVGLGCVIGWLVWVGVYVYSVGFWLCLWLVCCMVVVMCCVIVFIMFCWNWLVLFLYVYEIVFWMCWWYCCLYNWVMLVCVVCCCWWFWVRWWWLVGWVLVSLLLIW